MPLWESVSFLTTHYIIMQFRVIAICVAQIKVVTSDVALCNQRNQSCLIKCSKNNIVTGAAVESTQHFVQCFTSATHTGCPWHIHIPFLHAHRFNFTSRITSVFNVTLSIWMQACPQNFTISKMYPTDVLNLLITIKKKVKHSETLYTSKRNTAISQKASDSLPSD